MMLRSEQWGLTINLTTEHGSSCHLVPVAVIDGRAYGCEDKLTVRGVQITVGMMVVDACREHPVTDSQAEVISHFLSSGRHRYSYIETID